MFRAAFLCLQFGSVICWQKESSAKPAQNFFVKLTTRINFINYYEEPFCTKMFCKAFMCLQFGFVIFWKKMHEKQC